MTRTSSQEPSPEAGPEPRPEGTAPPPPVTAAERLRTIYRSPGPYASVYLSTLGEAEPLDGRWHRIEAQLRDQRAPDATIEAIAARLRLPAPPDTAATGVIAAADGTTVVDHATDPPLFDVAMVDTLPYASPMLEWQQRRVAHLVVTVDATGADVASFGLDHYTSLDSHEATGSALVDIVAAHQAAIDAALVVVAGPSDQVGYLRDHLASALPASCRVVIEADVGTADELADATVRHVADLVARTTVAHLRDHRFLSTHDEAVDGTAATIAALVDGTAGRILVHDDPADQRRLWVGDEPHQLSLEPRRDLRPARLVDALIWSAVTRSIPVHIIPSTGPTGPADDTAAIVEPDEPDSSIRPG